MANSILSSLVSQASFKLYNSEGASLFTGVKVKSVSVNMPARLLKNTDELGRQIIDSKVIMPITVQVVAFADSSESLSKINRVYENTNERYTIYSRGLYFEGLTVSDENIRMTGEVLSATPVTISFRGIMFQGDSLVVTAQGGDATTIIGGIVSTATAAVSKISSMAAKFFG